MLSYLGALISALLGIDIAAQLLGDGPQAYIGGPIGLGFFLLVYRSSKALVGPSGGVEPAVDSTDDQLPSPPPLPPEVLRKWESCLESPSPGEKPAAGKRVRHRPHKRRPKPLTVFERLKNIVDKIGK